MKTISAALLFAMIIISGRLCSASEITLEYGYDMDNPRVAYAFGPRDHTERYLLQALQQRALPDPILDTVSKVFTDYDTATVYDLLAAKDDRCLVSSLDKVVVQTFLFDTKLLRSLVAMDSTCNVWLLWKGAVINRSGGGVSLSFGMYKGHVYGALKGSTDVDSIGADTVFNMATGPFFDHWAAKECHLTLTFQRNDSAVCEIQTDYLALKIEFENRTHTIAGVPENTRAGGVRTCGPGIIRYTLDRPSFVGITVFTVAGAMVFHCENHRETAGPHTWTWNGRTSSGKRAPTGLYYIRITGATENTVHPLLLR